jgi:hypothetical protein
LWLDSQRCLRAAQPQFDGMLSDIQSKGGLTQNQINTVLNEYEKSGCNISSEDFCQK